MYLWRARRDRKTGLERHRVVPGFGHALLTPVATFAFESLGVSASIWEHGFEWMQLHAEPSTLRAEFGQGAALERFAYNERLLAEAIAKKRPVRGEHVGLSDLFVPILTDGRALGVLVVGPFATSQPNSVDLLERWRSLTGQLGHLADPAFADFLRQTLATLVLGPHELPLFERLLACIAKLLVAEGRADALANEAEALRVRLEKTRSFERICGMVSELVDERTARTWQSEAFSANRERFGLSRPPDSVLVGLTLSANSASDPVEDALTRYRFQRRWVEQLDELGEVIAGRVGDHGIVCLSSLAGSSTRRRSALEAFSERAYQMARKDFGLRLHFGACAPSRPQPLHRSYDQALGAAESALAKDERLVFAGDRERAARSSLRHLRQELSRVVLERPELLATRFDRYLETLASECGYMMAAARGQLDAGFERIAEPLVGRGALDLKSFDALTLALDHAARDARNLNELFAAYRTAVMDMAQAVERPVDARLEQRLRRAVGYIRSHYSEPLSSAAVAKLVGLTRTHFSKLFKIHEQKTFVEYVSDLRLARARQLLDDTELEVARIAELAGFRSAQYFSRVFRRAHGRTPLEQRARSRRQRDRRAASQKVNLK